MSGVLVVPGVFTPGSTVEIHHARNDRTLRIGAETEKLGQRIVGEDGNVGWDDLQAGERYFVTGYVDGVYTQINARATDGAKPSTRQAPPSAVPLRVGTQGAEQDIPEPQAPENASELQTGVAAGALDALPQTSASAEGAPAEVGTTASSGRARKPRRTKASPRKASTAKRGAKATSTKKKARSSK